MNPLIYANIQISPTFCLCSISKLWQQFRSSDNTKRIYAEYRAIVPNSMEVCSVYIQQSTTTGSVENDKNKRFLTMTTELLYCRERERECLCHSLFVYSVRSRARVNSSALYDIYIYIY